MLCPYDKNESFLLYKSNNNEKVIDVKCTSEIHNKPDLYKCKKCNLIFSEHYKSSLENSYAEVEDKKYIEQIPFKKKYFEIFFSKVKPFINNKSEVLEIGSYYGVLGDIIKPYVKNYTGLELSKHAANYSRNKLNLNIVNESLNIFLTKNVSFDAIIMSDVIEHLDDPFKTLDLIQKKLKKNGILIFSTFNMDSIVPRLLKGKYHWIMPMHKFYFSNNTLRYFLKENNMNIFKIKTDTRLVSVEYLLFKLCILVPKINFIFKFLLKFNFLKKMTIKINLLDLNIYFAKKLT